MNRDWFSRKLRLTHAVGLMGLVIVLLVACSDESVPVDDDTPNPTTVAGESVPTSTPEPTATPTHTSDPTATTGLASATGPADEGGVCRVGLQLRPGEQCSYEGFSIRIREDGAAVLDGNIGGISMGNTVMNAQSINLNRFRATKSGSTWTIEGLPGASNTGSTATPSGAAPSATPTKTIASTPNPSASPANQKYVRDGSTTVLGWDAVTGADYYKVYYDDFHPSACNLDFGRPSFCELLAEDVSDTSYIHDSPDDEDNYYWVVACNAGGCTDVDSENPATFVDTRPAASPANQEYRRDGSSAVVIWDPVERADFYKVYYDDFHPSACNLDFGRPSFCELLAEDVSDTSYIHDSPDDRDNYYWIVACNAGGCTDVDSASPARLVDSGSVQPPGDTTTPTATPEPSTEGKNLGPCKAGMTLSRGDSCSYTGGSHKGSPKVTFYVNDDGDPCRRGGPIRSSWLTVGELKMCTYFEVDEAFGSDLTISRSSDGWTIDSAP